MKDEVTLLWHGLPTEDGYVINSARRTRNVCSTMRYPDRATGPTEGLQFTPPQLPSFWPGETFGRGEWHGPETVSELIISRSAISPRGHDIDWSGDRATTVDVARSASNHKWHQ